MKLLICLFFGHRRTRLKEWNGEPLVKYTPIHIDMCSRCNLLFWSFEPRAGEIRIVEELEVR